MNDRSQNTEFCHYHPKQILVGVCPFCLTEKLLVVVAKQSRRKNHHQTSHSRKPSNVSLPKIFAFGSLLSRRHNKHQPTFYDCDEDGGCSDSQSISTSLEDSFISIKFEDNGIALWDENEVSKASQDQSTTSHNYKGLLRLSSWKSSSHKSMVEHSNTPRGTLRWRRRIGHFLQMVKWKRPNNKPSGGARLMSHVDGLIGVVKVRNKGWMRSLSRRRTCKE